jgi:transcriptional regulator with XRE-family HTH domain
MQNNAQTIAPESEQKPLYRNELLEQARQIKGWTRSKCATLAGVHLATADNCFAGLNAEIESLTKLAGALGVPMNRLFDFEGE